MSVGIMGEPVETRGVASSLTPPERLGAAIREEYDAPLQTKRRIGKDVKHAPGHRSADYVTSFRGIPRPAGLGYLIERDLKVTDDEAGSSDVPHRRHRERWRCPYFRLNRTCTFSGCWEGGGGGRLGGWAGR